MSSTPTYTSTKSFPYVYRCVHKETGKFYIGYRSANKIPSSKDLPVYKTSSKIVKPHFDDYDWEILAEFFDADSAYNFEQRLIFEEWTNPLILNLNCQYNGTKLRSAIGSKHSEETKKLLSKINKNPTPERRKYLSECATGKTHSEETKSKMSSTRSGRPAWNKGVKDSEETKKKKSESHIGKSKSEEHKLKIAESVKRTKLVSDERLALSASTSQTSRSTT